MDEKEKEQLQNKPITAELRGETIAFAVQSAIGNLGANLFEPYVSYQVQRYHSHHDKDHPGAGSYGQNLAGEMAGDLIGSAALVGAELLLPKQLHACSRQARIWIDPVFDSIAQNVVDKDCPEPEYEKKVHDWKTFQEKNLVRSALVGAAGIAGNIITQKTLFSNPAPTRIILEGKLLSTVLTTAIGLGTRFAFPESRKKVDDWMSESIFAPMMSDQTALGVEEPDTSHASKVLNKRENIQPEQVR